MAGPGKRITYSGAWSTGTASYTDQYGAMNMPNPGVTPVGTVVMFAGFPVTGQDLNILSAGWLPCDGSLYQYTVYPDLFNVIGESYGGSGGSFAVPRYSGLFIRGVDGGVGRDPDATSRIAPRPDLANAGNAGDNVGSVQMDRLGSHTHSYNYYSNYMKSSHVSGHECLSGMEITGMQSVGGLETRPINQYVNFIIKAVVSPDIVPLGAIIPFAGEVTVSTTSALSAAGWLPCNGTKIQISSYQELYQVIATSYGAENSSSFYLPDFRGLFLRGMQGQLASGQSPMDPDYQNRTAPQPNLQNPGNKGNNVGSIESSQFASHNHNYTYNNSYWNTAAAIGDHYAETNSPVTWTSGTNSTLAETRPNNINVNYIIKAQQLPSSKDH
jgi:microcystin-dependent protein